MYIIARLSRKSIDFINYINSAGLNHKDSFNIALAYSLSRDLPLPVGSVDDIDQYYRLHHESSIFNRLGMVNEVLSLNADAIRALARSFYAFRYQAANPSAIPLALRDCHGVADFFGISKFFSDGVLDVMEKQGSDITRMVNGFAEMLDDAVKSNQSRAEQAAIVEDRHVAA